MKKTEKSVKTDELDESAFRKRIILDFGRTYFNECPYPDKLSQEMGCFAECEICQEQDTCSSYIEEVLFPIFEGYAPEGSNLE